MLCVGPLDAVQRRHSDEGVSLFNQGTHVAEQQGEQQGCNVLTVNVGVGHDDDLAVAQFRQVEVFADSRSECGDQGANRIRAQCAVQASLFHVQNLASDRQNCLVFGVASANGRAACGVTLDDEDFAFFGNS